MFSKLKDWFSFKLISQYTGSIFRKALAFISGYLAALPQLPPEIVATLPPEIISASELSAEQLSQVVLLLVASLLWGFIQKVRGSK